MSVLNTTKETLEKICHSETVPMQGVWYGACAAEELEDWNYFVFSRYKTKKSSNKKDMQTLYRVHIVHEDYIPEGYIEEVIAALEAQDSGAKLRVTDDDIEYNYTFKSKTDMVVEIASIIFYHPEKRH